MGEKQRYIEDLFRRYGAAYNPNSAICKYWLDSMNRGEFLGPPMEPEHPSEDKSIVYQAFSSTVLWCYTSDFIVKEGYPP